MKKISILFIAIAFVSSISAVNQVDSKQVISKTHIKFFSHTVAEDIQANNFTSVATLDTQTGEVVFSVPMQGFEFEKALMQKHFNGADFLDTKQFPKAKLKGIITNIAQINFTKNGTYSAIVEGELTIKGVTKPITQKGTITISGGKVEGVGKFDITLSDYGISFVKGKPSSNIAKTVEVTVHIEY